MTFFSRIGRCTGCKQTSRRDYSETVRETVRRKIGGVGIGAVWSEATVTRYVRRNGSRIVKATDDQECPRCGALAWSAKAIEGMTNDTRCDARCTDAKGFRCECSCGGENHGRSFLVCEAIAA